MSVNLYENVNIYREQIVVKENYFISIYSLIYPKCYTYSMLEITPSISLEESELQFEYIRASGPGGQNVNGVCRKSLSFLQTNR